ncbi:MAG: glutamine amidotransferase [Desulfobacterales bacterium S3730MH5]|nr:MAG: glutamine amidotransferase [Desulfobacterales bacterium S3730MH5]OEU83981.1 MAG: glutamine amidotransferase [Desulfobacterales bacterium S5133MH4]
MSKRFLVLQHMPWEGPGRHLIHSAKKRKVRLEIVQVWHQPIPDIRSYDGLIVLGGSPNVDQENQYHYLRVEKETIHRVLDQDKPCLGFCLGHQIMAEALGVTIGPNFCRSVGFIEGYLTRYGRSHPMFRGISRSFPLFKWHAQAVLPPLPKEIQVLVTSAECQAEAISVEGRPHVVGLQFDNQSATCSDVGQWLESDQKWLSQPPGVDTGVVLQDAKKHEALMGEQFELMFTNYIELIF